MQQALHHLDNLAPVTSEHNTAVGNETFEKKRQHPTKLGKAAPLAVNSDWLMLTQWSEAAIDARTYALVNDALAHWSC